MYEKLVSIIVPIYNVEKYIVRCVDSLVKQTYKNLQIICVNDGSTDNSISILSSVKDNRIKVVSKLNGGLSSARNYGLLFVEGDFIVFVDSDDWVEPNYVASLIMQFEVDCVDIACVGFDYAYDDHIVSYKYSMKDNIVSSKRALNMLCKGKEITNHVWNKMFRTEIIKGVQFEEGRKFEDIYIMHLLFKRARKISLNSKVLYHYYMRSDSILHEKKPQNIADIAIGYISRYNRISGLLQKFFTLKKCAWAAYQILYLTENNNTINEDDYECIQKFWEAHKRIALLGAKYFLMYFTPDYYKRTYCSEYKQ